MGHQEMDVALSLLFVQAPEAPSTPQLSEGFGVLHKLMIGMKTGRSLRRSSMAETARLFVRCLQHNRVCHLTTKLFSSGTSAHDVGSILAISHGIMSYHP